MAKRSRGFKAFGLALPKMSDIKKSAKGMDILMGAGVGIVGILGFKWVMNKLTATVDSKGVEKKPIIDGSTDFMKDTFPKVAPLLGTALFGALAYALYSKKSKTKATGWLIGSLGAGAAVTGLSYIQSTDWAAKQGLASYHGFGVLQPDRRLPAMGLLQADSRASLNQLAAMSMGDLSGADELDALLS